MTSCVDSWECGQREVGERISSCIIEAVNRYVVRRYVFILQHAKRHGDDKQPAVWADRTQVWVDGVVGLMRMPQTKASGDIF